jgi:hypothetical protein
VTTAIRKTSKNQWGSGPLPNDAPGRSATKREWETAIKRGDWRDTKLPATYQQIALLLSTYAWGDGTQAHPGNVNLLRASGRGERTVEEALGALCKAGWLFLVMKGSARSGLASEYRLSIPKTQGE